MVAVTYPGRVQHGKDAGLDGRDLGVEFVATAAQFGQPDVWFDFGSVHDLSKQLDHGVQPGLGPHEGPAFEAHDPRVGLLERWCHLVVDFVIAGRVEPPQIPCVGGRPVVQIGPGLLRKPVFPALGGDLGVQSVQVVVQRRRDLAG